MKPTMSNGEHERMQQYRSSDASCSLSDLEEGPSSEEEKLLQTDPLSENHQPSRSFLKTLECTGTAWIAVPVMIVALIAAVFSIAAAASTELSISPKTQATSFKQFPIKTDDLGDYIECPTESPEAAKNAGCSFDVLLYGWLPDACFDADMYRDITTDADYGFYLDREGQRPIAMAELMKGDYVQYPEAYVSVEEHWQHCTYMLNSSLRFRAKEPPTALNLHLDQHHIGHCLKFLLDPATTRSLEVTQTRALFSAKRRCYLRQHAQFG
ncbi:uncharacterized protein LTHEOB_40 [Lasiodiplodia theobromae]|nr:uncharacterized protein LTHEOB_40 [Lasiodiplodia theobromae]KAF4543341.1 hypothetical protein LTHEOB_40 [Lasiodiplodia theobromae]